MLREWIVRCVLQRKRRKCLAPSHVCPTRQRRSHRVVFLRSVCNLVIPPLDAYWFFQQKIRSGFTSWLQAWLCRRDFLKKIFLLIWLIVKMFLIFAPYPLRAANVLSENFKILVKKIFQTLKIFFRLPSWIQSSLPFMNALS